MRLRQGQFSYLPELTDEEIKAQVQYAIDNGWAPAIEYTDDPHPRNTLWEMWDVPMFGVEDPQEVVDAINKCREAFPDRYIALVGYKATKYRQGPMLWFIVNRPEDEPGFRLDRVETNDRVIHYTKHSYAAVRPHGSRYGPETEAFAKPDARESPSTPTPEGGRGTA